MGSTHINPDVEYVLSVLQKIQFYADLEPYLQREIAERSWVRRNWQPGQPLFTAHDQPDRLCFIVKGIVEKQLVRSHFDGYDVIEHTFFHYGPGTVLGGGEMISGAAFDCKAVSLTPCEFVIMGDWYRSLAEEHASLLRCALLSSQELRRKEDEFQFNMSRARGKALEVAHVLLNIARAVDSRIVEDDSNRFPFKITWWDHQVQAAELFDMARATLKEALKAFERIGAISVGNHSGNTITFPLELLPDCIGLLEKHMRTALAPSRALRIWR